MKIVIISKGAFPQIKGGAELVVDRVKKNFKKRGHKVFLITKKWKLINGTRPEMSQIVSWEWSKMAAERAVKIKPDVVYINQYWWEGASLFIPKKIPVVLMAHDLGFLETNLDPEMRYQMIDVWHKSIKRANRIIAPGKITHQRILITFPQAKKKLVYIPLGID